MDMIDFKRYFLKHQLDALKNESYSVLLVNRIKEKTAFVYAKNADTESIINNFKQLTLYNNKNFDVYIKAENSCYYNIIVDDLTLEKARNLLNEYYVNYMIYSSNNNFQAVILLKKELFTKAQADFLVKFLNKKFGDPNFSGANHFFRLCGFNNKKQKNNDEIVKPVDYKNKIDEHTSLNKLFALAKQAEKKEVKKANFEVKTVNTEATLNSQKKAQAEKEVKAEIAFCKKTFKNLDWSAVDFRIAKRLYKKNFDANEIAQALTLFTDFENRHSNKNDYLNRTISKAITEINRQK